MDVGQERKLERKTAIRRIPGILLGVFLWLAAAAAGVVEAALVWAWIHGLRYLERFGAEENLYAAEDTWVLGVCAVFQLLPLALLVGCAAVYTRRLKKKVDP